MSKLSVWRHASREPNILGIPVAAFCPLIIFMFHIAKWTFFLSIGCIILFAVLRYCFNFRLNVMFGRIRHFIRGSHVHARPWWYKKYYQGLEATRRKDQI